jgi:hypothetical protein
VLLVIKLMFLSILVAQPSHLVLCRNDSGFHNVHFITTIFKKKKHEILKRWTSISSHSKVGKRCGSLYLQWTLNLLNRVDFNLYFFHHLLAWRLPPFSTRESKDISNGFSGLSVRGLWGNNLLVTKGIEDAS